jgi:hypothetical protein
MLLSTSDCIVLLSCVPSDHIPTFPISILHSPPVLEEDLFL